MLESILSITSVALVIVFIILRVPVAIALGLVGFVGYALLDGFKMAGAVVGSVPNELIASYTFSVVPLFTLMGSVAAVSGLSADLFRAAESTMRGLRGSLSMSAIIASALFGAVCGSSVATAMTMGKVSIPEMLKRKYSPSLAAGSVAAGGTLGVLIPPSLILMIYAIIAEQSVSQLFLAALVPGLILTALYSLIAFFLGSNGNLSPNDIQTATEDHTLEPTIMALAKVWHIGLLFVFTIGGIYSGFFTPTEAAAVGAFGSIFLGFVLRRLSLTGFKQALFETVKLVSSIVFIIIASTIYSYFIVQTGAAKSLASALNELELSGVSVVIVLCAFYIILGCFLDGLAMMLITVPITLPLILSYGMDPVWFGVLLVILIEIGLITPPLGMNLFVIKAVAPNIKTSEIYRGVAPFFVAPIILIMILISWPELTQLLI